MDLNALLAELKKKAAEWLAKNGGQIPKIPEIPKVPAPTEESAIVSDKVFGVMLTDLLCDTQLENRRSDLLKLRAKYNTILSVLDLQKNGTKQTRPYVDWARSRTELTALGEKNITFLHGLGFKVHVITLNAWGAKSGFTQQMGSTQEPLPNEASLYSDKQLEREKSLLSDLLSKVGDKIDGIMPALECTQPQAARFNLELAKFLREQGFKGKIVFNLISSAGQELQKLNFRAYNVLLAPSINTPAQWRASSADIRNTDGMTELTDSRGDLIAEFTRTGGPQGFYLWSSSLVGSKAGRSSYASSWVTSAANLGSTTQPKPEDPVKPHDPPRPEVPGESPEARHKRLYPKVQLTGGNAGTATNKTLWKPQADVNGKPTGNLVIVTAHNFPKINYVSVEKGGANIEKKGIDTVITAGNGYRLNWRFSKKGGSYGSGLTLRVSTVEGDYTGSIPNGGSRVDPVDMKKVSNIPVPQDPKPFPKPQEPKPETPVVTPVNKWFVASESAIWLHPKLNSTVERVVFCFNLPNNLYENAKYVGNNTYQFSKPFSQYQRGTMDSVIGVKVTKMLPQLKDMWRSNGTYQINPVKNIFDDPHTTPHPPVPPPNEGDVEPKPDQPNPDPKPNPSTPSDTAYSKNGVLFVPQWLNARLKRAQVIYQRNGWAPATPVSGAPGAGIENGFLWWNAGWNEKGIYDAKKPLSQWPTGKKGGAIWLLTGKDNKPPFASHDYNMVVEDVG